LLDGPSIVARKACVRQIPVERIDGINKVDPRANFLPTAAVEILPENSQEMDPDAAS